MRVPCKTIDEVIVQAMEHADEFDEIIVIGQRKPEFGGGFRFFAKDTTTLSVINWLVDCVKSWIFLPTSE